MEYEQQYPPGTEVYDTPDPPPSATQTWLTPHWNIWRLTWLCQLVWLVLYALIAVVGYSIVGYRMAKAQDIQAGVGLVCDTQAQVERFIAVLDNDPQVAIEQVNAEAGVKNACIVAGVYYIRGKEARRVMHKGNGFVVIQILVLGVQTPQGPRMLPEPVVWFSFEKTSDREA